MYETFPITLQRPQQRFDYFQGLIEWLFCPMHMTRCLKSEFGTTPLEARARRGGPADVAAASKGS